MKKEQNFIFYLRAFSVCCIFCCHIFSASPSAYISMLSQFFNIGVELFFIISAFCFGLQGNITNSRKWYLKRIKRIFVPYEIFLVVIVLIYAALSKALPLKNWITCVFGIQGANVGVLGADQTWFEL